MEIFRFFGTVRFARRSEINTLEKLGFSDFINFSHTWIEDGRYVPFATLNVDEGFGRKGTRENSVESFEAQHLARMVLPDVGVNVLGELGGFLAVRALVFRRHAALVAQMPCHVFL